MPYRELPTFKSVPDKMLEIPQPGIGGLNLKDLEFEQEVNQSPYMLNVMYRNGVFGKRYGQEVFTSFEYEIYSMITFGGDIFVHAGENIYKYGSLAHTTVASGMPTRKGIFIIYAQKLFYLISSGLYEYKNNTFTAIDAYIPDVFINCKPDGSYADPIDDYNVLGNKFRITYNGESGVTEYKVYGDDDSVIDWSVTPTIKVDDVQTSAFTVDSANKKVTFTTAPPEGNLNVEMVFTLKDTVHQTEREQIYSCKYYETFGGSNNSRLFLAGGGLSKYFYSEAYDVSFFPESNFATLGNTEDDITGFGRQYNVLIMFKAKEIYSISSYTETAATTVIEENYGLEAFRSQLVNPKIGCDCPNTIQLINNLLTWFNSSEGICTLVSTNIQDERNIRIISRNIERSNSFGLTGILDLNEDLDTIQSADYNNKYFICFPEHGYCFIWDYEISPYRYSSAGETSPEKLDWFLFDKFYVKQFLKVDKQLLYASSHSDFNKKVIKLNDSFMDLDFDNDGVQDSIHSFYMTPFLQFGAVEYLKNIKNIFVQCRGDTSSVIDMWYYTEESAVGEMDPESIRIGGKLWEHFQWNNFQWLQVAWANTFRRKCNLKKIQMASFYFDNNEVERDMSITHISLQYQVVKTVR